MQFLCMVNRCECSLLEAVKQLIIDRLTFFMSELPVPANVSTFNDQLARSLASGEL